MSKPYNIFISWSGDRSKSIAECLKDWLPRVVQSARPWLSTRDIEKGTRSLSEMNRALGGMGFGIACLTPENLDARWILYEAGALSKTFDDDRSRLWTYLLGDVDAQDVEPPLSQFQHTKADREDTLKLIQSINTSINTAEDRLPDDVVKDSFNAFWPDLDKKLKSLPAAEKPAKAKRTSDEMIGEILELCRQYLPQIDALDSNPIRQSVTLSSLAGLAEPGPAFNRFATIAALLPKVTYSVKVKSDPEIKKVSGTSHLADSHTLQVFDRGTKVAEFENIEYWSST